MKNLDWEALKLFIHVARNGSLSAAAAELGSSPATLGRRMLGLEKSLGKALFVRRQSGYDLTPDGRSLLSKALAMEASARPIADWLDPESRRPTVRVSAGTWTANFLVENFFRLWSPDDPFRIAFKTTELRLDIGHREVEIGIRNAEPTEANLASRRLNEVAYAAFRARNRPNSAPDEWVAIPEENAVTRAARWVAAQERIAAWADTPRTLYDLVRAGVGKGVFPCFAGDRDGALERAGPPVEALREGQWIVMHDDDRHRPEVRVVIERLAALLRGHAALFAGERPIG